MTDINAVIAKHKGYTKPQNGYCWIDSIGQACFSLPDWEHDARLYMALFEEMGNPGLRKHGLQWYCCPNMNASSALNHIAVYSDTIGSAICLAYCKLHGLECEG